ncbi:MAG: hypothetical protein L0Z07_08095 [Planctomycetes bacterium]|nr:hypothetical protein [Planctomycetota bacterium]
MYHGRRISRLLVFAMLAGMVLGALSGCHLIIPDISYQPVIHNPFPQLSRVAVAPFFNQSDESTVDGRQFALAYYGELQAVPGFELVPVPVVEEAILDYQIDLSRPEEARRLAKVLGVDAIVIGSITDYSPYYPPRCGLRVEWYAANPGFHEIPPGYGLPWGTPEEEFIPAPLVFEAEMALARAQLATQSPPCDMTVEPPPAPPAEPAPLYMPLLPPAREQKSTSDPDAKNDTHAEPDAGKFLPPVPDDTNAEEPVGETHASFESEQPTTEQELPDGAGNESLMSVPSVNPESNGAPVTIDAIGTADMLPANWPDERGFIPPGPSPAPPPCLPNDGPIMTHTRIYHGHDSEFTEALASYYHFRDDARFGGWQTYLQRSDDFIRFCCHMHLSEMLSARGGAGETRVVWRWSKSR